MANVNHRWLVAAGVLVYLAFIFLFRLGEYPVPWHDESDYLQVAKNFVTEGVYADYSSGEGFRYTGPVISVGPTVILPVALVYKLFGVGILVARLTVVLYGLLTLVLIYALGVNLLDARLAIVAVILVLASEGLEFLYYSRHVIGEVPGLFFMFAGLWLWLRPGRPGLPLLVLVGVLFGLACITKNQYAVFILPALLLAWFLDLFWYKNRGWRHFVVVGIVAGVIFFAWTYYAWFMLGAEARDVAQDVTALREAGASSLFLIDPGVNINNILYLMSGEVYGGLFVPGVILGFVLGWRRDEDGQRWGTLGLFLLISGVLYVFSIGWPRMAMPTVALVAFLVARLLYALTGGFQPDWEGLRALFQDREVTLRTSVNLVVIGLVLGVAIFPLLRQAYNVVVEGSGAAYMAAAYIREHIAQDAMIETWEEELAVLTDHEYHYPPQIMETHRVNHVWFEGPPVHEFYDFREYVDPQYVISGPFADQAEIYIPETLENYELIETIDFYDIYIKQ